MVKLYGVYHGYTATLLLEGRLLSQSVEPSTYLLADLQKLPKGARIGIEWLKEEDWEDARRHLAISAFDAKLSLGKMPRYSYDAGKYWNEIANFCNENGYEAVFLEDKETFKRYNEATIKLVKTNKNIYTHEHEDDGHYHLRLVRQNEREYKGGVLCREIHEIERDDKLLEAIMNNNLDAAVVGLGHSDYWMFNQIFDRMMFNKKTVERKTGIEFESYSTEKLKGNYDRLEQIFTLNALPDRQQVYEREGLERTLRLIKTGKVTDKKPDFVGTWDVMFPTQGYFEMFVDKDEEGRISGSIEDCLGSGFFEGRLTSEELSFVKVYNGVECTGGVVAKPIEYRATRKDNEFYGHFYVEGLLEDAFYMAEAQKEKPINMSLRWRQLAKKPNHPI